MRQSGEKSPFHKFLRYDNGNLFWKVSRGKAKAGGDAGRLKSSGYIEIKLFGRSYQAHRVIWEMHHGEIPSNLVVDHINHDRSDNRIENLRVVEQRTNTKNQSMRITNRSGVNGVRWYEARRKFRAEIKVDRKSISLGYYETIIDAKAARMRAEKEYKFHENHGKKNG